MKNLFSEDQKCEMRYNIHEFDQHLFPAYLHAEKISTASKKKKLTSARKTSLTKRDQFNYQKCDLL